MGTTAAPAVVATRREARIGGSVPGHHRFKPPPGPRIGLDERTKGPSSEVILRMRGPTFFL
jgi:hypothetical protein